MSTQIERSRATRSRILAVARAAFVRDGFDGASLEKIAAEAGFTKGALYHHYNGKEALFAAVFSLVALETVRAAGRHAADIGAPRERLKAATMAWLTALERGDARTILLDRGPGALGFERARALEDAVALEPLLTLVREVIEVEGLHGALDALFAARLINAALAEIAMLRRLSDGQVPDVRAAARAISGVVDGVLRPI